MRGMRAEAVEPDPGGRDRTGRATRALVPDQRAALAAHQAAFAATVAHADPDVAVPWCGRWRVGTLVVHLARIHHWAAGQARRRQETPLGRGPFDLPELYERCAAELRTTLAELDPDARAWTLLDDGVPRQQQRGTVAFWHRRQALETLVHLWDLRTAVGEPLEVGVVHWLDCVDEVVEVLHPRQVRLGRIAAPPARVRWWPPTRWVARQPGWLPRRAGRCAGRRRRRRRWS